MTPRPENNPNKCTNLFFRQNTQNYYSNDTCEAVWSDPPEPWGYMFQPLSFSPGGWDCFDSGQGDTRTHGPENQSMQRRDWIIEQAPDPKRAPIRNLPHMIAIVLPIYGDYAAFYWQKIRLFHQDNWANAPMIFASITTLPFKSCSRIPARWPRSATQARSASTAKNVQPIPQLVGLIWCVSSVAIKSARVQISGSQYFTSQSPANCRHPSVSLAGSSSPIYGWSLKASILLRFFFWKLLLPGDIMSHILYIYISKRAREMAIHVY